MNHRCRSFTPLTTYLGWARTLRCVLSTRSKILVDVYASAWRHRSDVMKRRRTADLPLAKREWQHKARNSPHAITLVYAACTDLVFCMRLFCINTPIRGVANGINQNCTRSRRWPTRRRNMQLSINRALYPTCSVRNSNSLERSTSNRKHVFKWHREIGDQYYLNLYTYVKIDGCICEKTFYVRYMVLCSIDWLLELIQ